MKGFFIGFLGCLALFQISAAQTTSDSTEYDWLEIPREVFEHIEKHGFEKPLEKEPVRLDPSPVHTLPYRSGENRISLILANTSQSELRNLEVKAAGIPSGVRLNPVTARIGSVEPGSHREAVFEFLLTEETLTGQTLEVPFVVTDGKGNRWEKSIRLRAEATGEFRLEQNYPNPFNPSTTISYQLPEAMNVRVTVYDLAGRRVASLLDSSQPAGSHRVHWDASRVASGVYFYRIVAENGNGKQIIQNRKMVLIK